MRKKERKRERKKKRKKQSKKEMKEVGIISGGGDGWMDGSRKSETDDGVVKNGEGMKERIEGYLGPKGRSLAYQNTFIIV